MIILINNLFMIVNLPIIDTMKRKISFYECKAARLNDND